MAAITLRIEPETRDGTSCTVAAVLAGLAGGPARLWYRLDPAPAPPLEPLAVAHAFTVSAVAMAMAAGRDLAVDGPLTAGLIENLAEFQRGWSAWMPDRFRPVAIRQHSLVPDEPYRPERRIVLPYSGGLDSAFSALTLARDGSLGTLVAIRGLDIALADAGRWAGALAGMRSCAQSLGVPLVEAATNWQEVAPGRPGHLGYFAPVIAVPLLLSGHAAVAMPSAYPYVALDLPHETNPISDPLLGRPGFPVRHHGAWMRRIDKADAIAGWPEGVAALRSCVDPGPDGGPCRRCRKCLQTALLFAALGHPVPASLGGAVPAPEAIEGLEDNPYTLVALDDAVRTARGRGLAAAWIDAAERRLLRAGLRTTAGMDAERESHELRRRLDYVLGGTGRPAPARLMRRIARTLRGRSGPHGLPAWTGAPPPPRPAGPPPVHAETPAAARSPGGRAIHVDPDDRRGHALLARAGDLNPVSLRLWRRLVDAGPWTDVVDVGANYGEMLVDLDLPAGTRVVAVEPNPHVCWHLARTLQEAGRPVTLVQKALSDREGTLALTIDRTWSGLSAAAVSPAETAGHRLEPILVHATTLARLLAAGTDDDAKRVLVKIDVEGHEAAVLRGLGDAARSFAAFAAMIEMHHLPEPDRAEILAAFTVELFEPATGALVPVPDADPARLAALLAGGRFHAQDVVLRARI